jgi:hypothetical protein
VEKSFVKGAWQQTRSYSPAVITAGNQAIVWVAGHTGATMAARWRAISTPNFIRFLVI